MWYKSLSTHFLYHNGVMLLLVQLHQSTIKLLHIESEKMVVLHGGFFCQTKRTTVYQTMALYQQPKKENNIN